jgi:hypothetical protein
MITTLPARIAIAVALLARRAPVVAAGACELAGLGCAGVFLHIVWPPLVWAAAAAVLLLIGQRR